MVATRNHGLFGNREGPNEKSEDDGEMLLHVGAEPNFCSRQLILFHLARLLKDFPFFSGLEQHMQSQLPHLTACSWNVKGCCMFMEGDVADACYIILTGEVLVWRRLTEEQKREQTREWMLKREQTRESIVYPRRDSDPNADVPRRRSAAEESCRGSNRRRSATDDICQDPNADGRRRQSNILHVAVAREQPLSPSVADSSSPKSNKGDLDFCRKELWQNLPVSAGSSAIVRKCGQMVHMLEQAGPDQDDIEVNNLISNKTESSKLMTISPNSKSVVAKLSPRLSKARHSLVEKRDSDSDSFSSDERGSEDLHENEGDDLFGKVLARLGPGSLFGETGLIDDAPRNSTIQCNEDSVFLSISKDTFNLLVKKHLQQEAEAKRNFIRKHVPGMTDLSEREFEDLSYHFKAEQFPKNHCFVKQHQHSRGELFFVVKGSVELRQECAMGSRAFGCLTSGSSFGSMTAGEREPFSIVAVTEPVHVFKLIPKDLKNLRKDSGLVAASQQICQKFADQAQMQLSWRESQSDFTANTLVGLAPKPKVNLEARSSSFLARKRRKPPRKTVPIEEMPVLDLEPGELIAMKGQLPRMLPPSKCAPTLDQSSLDCCPSSQPLSRPVSGMRLPPSRSAPTLDQFSFDCWPNSRPSSRPVSGMRMSNCADSSIGSRPMSGTRPTSSRPMSGKRPLPVNPLGFITRPFSAYRSESDSTMA